MNGQLAHSLRAHMGLYQFTAAPQARVAKHNVAVNVGHDCAVHLPSSSSMLLPTFPITRQGSSSFWHQPAPLCNAAHVCRNRVGRRMRQLRLAAAPLQPRLPGPSQLQLGNRLQVHHVGTVRQAQRASPRKHVCQRCHVAHARRAVHLRHRHTQEIDRLMAAWQAGRRERHPRAQITELRASPAPVVCRIPRLPGSSVQPPPLPAAPHLDGSVDDGHHGGRRQRLGRRNLAARGLVADAV